VNANTVASKTMASDRRTRGGCEIDIDGLVKANGVVLATSREEAAKEHGGDVLGWLPRAEAEMGGVGPWWLYFGVVEGLHHADSEPSCLMISDIFHYIYLPQSWPEWQSNIRYSIRSCLQRHLPQSPSLCCTLQ
jgi:hypothetical protein